MPRRRNRSRTRSLRFLWRLNNRPPLVDIAYANYERIADIPHAVGFIAPNVRVEIVDDDDIPLRPKELGRLRCQSEYFVKVLAANERDQGKDTDGIWFYSGDRGSITEEGVLCISEVERGNER